MSTSQACQVNTNSQPLWVYLPPTELRGTFHGRKFGFVKTKITSSPSFHFPGFLLYLFYLSKWYSLQTEIRRQIKSLNHTMPGEKETSNPPNRLIWHFPDDSWDNLYTLNEEKVKLTTFANCMLSTINISEIWIIGRTSKFIHQILSRAHIICTALFLECGFQRWI